MTTFRDNLLAGKTAFVAGGTSGTDALQLEPGKTVDLPDGMGTLRLLRPGAPLARCPTHFFSGAGAGSARFARAAEEFSVASIYSITWPSGISTQASRWRAALATTGCGVSRPITR